MIPGRALITGASRGIGAAFARELAARGTPALTLVARSVAPLEALADELAGLHGTAVEVLPADLADAGQRARVETRLTSDDDPVDLLVNNAGVGHHGPLADADAAEQRLIVEVDVIAVARLAHAAARAMEARGGGAIVNVASVMGAQPVPQVATYAASKAFVRSLSEALAEELAGRGVAVLALCPGFTRTEIFERSGASARAVPSVLWHDTERVAREALDAIGGHRAVVTPGLPYKLLTAATPRLPRGAVRRIGGILSRLG
jgi:uncharacterized protein